MDNARQVAEWNGSVGERWAADQERTDQLVRPYGNAALAAAEIAPGEAVLDVGCGCGDTSLAAAGMVGAGGRVVGVDVSVPMLAVARRRTGGSPNLTFLEADAASATLPGPFDVLVSRFGVMFFDDPARAFAHLHTAMRSGGRLAFVCWRTPAENPWAAIPAQAARKAARIEAPPSDPHAPGPFAFGDGDRLKGLLEGGRFRNVRLETFEAPMYLGSSPRSAAEGTARIGPASRVALKAGPEHRPAILDAIEAALGPYAAADGTVSLPGRTWIVTARA
jgi:SAM-dependent methyltransferase